MGSRLRFFGEYVSKEHGSQHGSLHLLNMQIDRLHAQETHVAPRSCCLAWKLLLPACWHASNTLHGFAVWVVMHCLLPGSVGLCCV